MIATHMQNEIKHGIVTCTMTENPAWKRAIVRLCSSTHFSVEILLGLNVASVSAVRYQNSLAGRYRQSPGLLRVFKSVFNIVLHSGMNTTE